jgi:hypothetical protein
MVPNQKEPAILDWRNQATNDLAKIDLVVRSLQGLQRWGSHWRRSTSARCRYEECWQLICKYLSEAGRTEPQFDPEWIEQKVRNAYTYGPGAPGECSGLFEFGDSGGRALSAVGDWGEPTNLWSADIDPPNLPVGVVPELVELYARDRGRRLGVEPGGVAALTIVALSSLIHASNCIQVQQKDPHWTERPILWGMLIGNPGSNKSATLTQVIAPVAHLEQTWKQEFVRKLAAHTDFEATNDKSRASTPRSDQKNLAPYSRRKGRSYAPC